MTMIKDKKSSGFGAIILSSAPPHILGITLTAIPEERHEKPKKPRKYIEKIIRKTYSYTKKK
jgi:hypothetical protein